MAHLYVMQNQYGLVKVGRSARPEYRRTQLEKSDLCAIDIVAVIMHAGEREEACHQALDAYRIIGEWFHGTAEALVAIASAVGLPSDTIWPHALAEIDALDAWTDANAEQRWARRVDREFQSQIRDMETRQFAIGEADTVRWDDGKIWSLLWEFEAGLSARVETRRGKKGTAEFWGVCEGKQDTLLPHYSTKIEDALSVWPEEVRPSAWPSTPRACCIAGLKARKSKLPKISHTYGTHSPQSLVSTIARPRCSRHSPRRLMR